MLHVDDVLLGPEVKSHLSGWAGDNSTTKLMRRAGLGRKVRMQRVGLELSGKGTFSFL